MKTSDQMKVFFHYIRQLQFSRKIRWIRYQYWSLPPGNCIHAKLWDNVRLANYPPALTYKQQQTRSHCCLVLLCLSICGIHVTLIHPSREHLSPDETTILQAQLQHVAVAPSRQGATERIRAYAPCGPFRVNYPFDKPCI